MNIFILIIIILQNKYYNFLSPFLTFFKEKSTFLTILTTTKWWSFDNHFPPSLLITFFSYLTHYRIMYLVLVFVRRVHLTEPTKNLHDVIWLILRESRLVSTCPAWNCSALKALWPPHTFVFITRCNGLSYTTTRRGINSVRLRTCLLFNFYPVINQLPIEKQLL